VIVSRVAETAALIAHRRGLDAATTKDCILAAWLHDVGELARPDRRPAIPRAVQSAAHVLAGARLLGDIPQLGRAAAIVRHQREHYDGSGVPDGLAGEAIPLAARVLAAAVRYTAPTPRRGRRLASPVDAVRAASGRELDPDVVRALVDAVDAAA